METVAATSKDPRFRKYTASVERILQTFDTVNEWADFIRFLSSLAKVLAGNTEFKEIPMKLTIAKRLAQCLNPALPSGVHSKCLELYSLIFNIIGLVKLATHSASYGKPEQLAHDLRIYSFGLFPLLQYASMAVKPQTLKLYHDYYLRLGQRLRPCVKGLILALLPGLEEESNEHFNATIEIMDEVQAGLEISSIFYRAFFLVMMACPLQRLAAVNYLLKRFPALSDQQIVSGYLGCDQDDGIEVAVSALAASLADSNMLVQRGILDVLLAKWPLNIRFMSENQRTKLVKAVLCVVLRKDMSLSRRVFNWIIASGKGEEAAASLYLHPVCSAVRQMLYPASPQIADLIRPYKIMVSLLDQPDLGPALIIKVFEDFIRSCNSHLRHLSQTAANELLQTFNMLLSLVDSRTVWCCLMRLMNSVTAGDLDLVRFFIDNCKFREHEENSMVHYPALFLFSMEKLDLNCTSINDDMLYIALKSLQSINETYFSRLTKSASIDVSEYSEKISTLIRRYYLDGDREVWPSVRELISSSFFVNALELIQNHLQSIADISVNVDTTVASATKLECLGYIYSIITSHVPQHLRLKSEADPADNMTQYFSGIHRLKWVKSLTNCASNVRLFQVAHAVLQLLFTLVQSTRFLPLQFFHSRQLVFSLIYNLWRFLGTESIETDLLVVQHIWRIYEAAPPHTVEDFISSYLVQDDLDERSKSFQKFGIFWRISDGLRNSSIAFTNPLFIMVNLLKNHNPQLKRQGEMFLRNSLKSFSRLLDPVLLILLDPSIFRKSRSHTSASGADDEEFVVDFYAAPFNGDQVNHVFEIIYEVLNYGGPEFVLNISKLIVETEYLQVLIDIFVSQASDKLIFKQSVDQQWTYLEILLTITLDFMLTEVDISTAFEEDQQDVNTAIQCHAAELLRLILSRLLVGQTDSTVIHLHLAQIQSIILQKLLFCIRTERLEVQPRLLSILNLAFSSLCGRPIISRQLFSSSTNSFEIDLKANNVGAPRENTQQGPDFPVAFLPVIREAFSRQSNKLLLSYYADFLNSTISNFQEMFKPILHPIIDILLSELEVCMSKKNALSKTSAIPRDLELLILLSSLDKLFRFSWLEARWGMSIQQHGQDRRSNESSLYGLRGLTDMVTGVFSGDNTAAQQCLPEQLLTETLFHEIARMLSALQLVWQGINDKPSSLNYGFAKSQNLMSMEKSTNTAAIRGQPASDGEGGTENLSSAANRIRRRVIRLVETIYSLSSSTLVEVIVIKWSAGRHVAPMEAQECVALDILQAAKMYQPKVILFSVLELIKDRMATANVSIYERCCSFLDLPNIRLAEHQFLRFLEFYAGQRASIDSLVEVYPQILTLIKDYLSQPSAFKNSLLPLLKAYNSILIRLPVSYIEDRRFKKETYDSYQKLVDCCTWIAGRSFDSGIWRKKDSSSSGALNQNEITIDAISRLSPEIPIEAAGPGAETQAEINQEKLVRQITVYLAEKVIPSLRQIISEQDRWQAIISSMVYYVITPNLKLRANHPYSLLVDLTLDLLLEIGRIPAVYKLWRKEVWDVLCESRFFGIDQSTFDRWSRVAALILQNEKERFMELTSRISLSSAGIFISKEQEQYNRSQAFRKLSFFLLASAKDQLIQHLPAVQEKLVDAFRQPYSSVYADTFLCTRLLIFKFSPRLLANFWPTILTELIRVFEEFGKTLAVADDGLLILLSAAKLLDLLVCCSIEHFQIYDWIFLNESVGLVERLESFCKTKSLYPPYTAVFSETKRRRPLIPISFNSPRLQQHPESFDIDSLVPYLLRIARANVSLLLQKVDNFYDPFLKLNDAFVVEPVSAGSAVNEITIDVDYIKEWLAADILETSNHNPHSHHSPPVIKTITDIMI